MTFILDLQAGDERGLRDDPGRGPRNREAALPRDLRHRGQKGGHDRLRRKEKANLERPIISIFFNHVQLYTFLFFLVAVCYA